jgi:hypothetical protein
MGRYVTVDSQPTTAAVGLGPHVAEEAGPAGARPGRQR